MILNPKFEELTSLEILDKIKQFELEGKFSEHIDPINPDYSKVDENYPYIPDEDLKKHYDKVRKKYIKPYLFLLFNFLIRMKVRGKENLKGLDKAIVTCNHVNKVDSLCVQKALKPRKFNVIGAPFNNQNGLVGDFLKAGGMLPLADDYKGMKKFNEAFEYYLNQNSFILIFPETSEWWCYEKPRPYANGAFHYATKFNVPILPVFITFKDRKFAKDKFGLKKKKFIVNIMAPIYPNKDLNNKENVEFLKNANFNCCKAKYEEFYGKKLEYTTKSE
jgi:1-acyl-sn-glycerol-3-phosphate acyltransferase